MSELLSRPTSPARGARTRHRWLLVILAEVALIAVALTAMWAMGVFDAGIDEAGAAAAGAVVVDDPDPVGPHRP